MSISLRSWFSNAKGSFTGLQPRAWICVGSGFVREEIKALLVAEELAYVGEVVTNVQGLCLKILASEGMVKDSQVLGSTARQEILRTLLAEPRISKGLPELKHLKRQTSFFRKLDRAMQSGRMAFAHEAEESVQNDRLAEKLGVNPVRQELRVLAPAYEAWLEASNLWDPPLLLKRACDALRAGLHHPGFLPAEIYLLSAQTPESLEQEFWDLLSRHCDVRRPFQVPIADFGTARMDRETGEPRQTSPDSLGSLDSGKRPTDGPAPPTLTWTRWHTLDDAAEGLADELCADFAEYPEGLATQAILIPDQPAIRRSLARALAARGIPLADPRDPTRLRWDESLKWALRPLEVVARGFERDSVISWLGPYVRTANTLSTQWIQEIQARGIRSGLGSYAGGILDTVHSRLNELQQSFGGKRSCEDLSKAHLEQLRIALGTDSEKAWLLPFFETTWRAFCEDIERVGLGSRKAHALYWLERLESRLEEATPPVDFSKPKTGVQLYRLGQAPLFHFPRLFLFGFPAAWISGEGAGDYWFPEREREVLASEFQVRSGATVRADRERLLKAWLAQTAEVRLEDAQYDWDGRERESPLPALQTLGLVPKGEEREPIERGAHPRWLPSFGAVRPIAPLRVELPPLQFFRPSVSGKPEIRATELDRYSRCGFLALAASRWKIRDLREAEAELWPDMRGNVLHEAVRLLLESRGDDGTFALTPEEALAAGWKKAKPRGLLKGERLEQYTRKKLLPVLETFCEKEREYLKRSGTRILSLEGPELRLEDDEFTLYGIPDRIDEHPDGVFVLDYKTSGTLPNGTDMVEKGYRLQLPFYALAARQRFQKAALGVQFVELNRKGGRSSGIFFKQWDGKEAGKLTKSRSKKSMFESDPEEVWQRVEEQLKTNARGYGAGRFEAQPKKDTECRTCVFDDFCGRRRVLASGAIGSGEEGESGAELP